MAKPWRVLWRTDSRSVGLATERAAPTSSAKVFQWSGATDVFVGFDQRATQFPIAPKTGDLALDFPLRRRIRKALRNGLALNLVSESKVRTVAGIVRPVTVAIRIATAASSRRNRAGTEIIQSEDLLKYLGTTLLNQQGIGCRTPAARGEIFLGLANVVA